MNNKMMCKFREIIKNKNCDTALGVYLSGYVWLRGNLTSKVEECLYQLDDAGAQFCARDLHGNKKKIKSKYFKTAANFIDWHKNKNND